MWTETGYKSLIFQEVQLYNFSLGFMLFFTSLHFYLLNFRMLPLHTIQLNSMKFQCWLSRVNNLWTYWIWSPVLKFHVWVSCSTSLWFYLLNFWMLHSHTIQLNSTKSLSWVYNFWTSWIWSPVIQFHIWVLFSSSLHFGFIYWIYGCCTCTQYSSIQ